MRKKSEIIKGTSVGEILRKVNPSAKVLYNIFVSANLPFNISFEENENGYILTIGEYRIIPVGERCCVENRNETFMRVLDASLRAYNLTMSDYIDNKLK